MGVILVGSVLPAAWLPDSGGFPPGFDKWVHAGFYFVLAILVAGAVGRGGARSAVTAAAAALVLSTSFGTLIEVIQDQVGRDAQIGDVGADLLGAAAGLVVWLSARHRTPSPTEEGP